MGQHGSDLVSLDAALAPDVEQQADQTGSKPLVHDRPLSLARETRPVEPRSALLGRVQASSSEPTPLPERIEVKVTQSAPLVGAPDSPTPQADDGGRAEEPRESVQGTMMAEEEYEEPVYASIRPASREVAPNPTASPIGDRVVTGKAANDDFAEPVFASIRDPIAEPIRQESHPSADKDLAPVPSESGSTAGVPHVPAGSSPSDDPVAAAVAAGQPVNLPQEGMPKAEPPSATEEEVPPEKSAPTVAADDYEEPVFASIRPR